MAKYDALFRHFCTAGDDAVEMTFDEIEELVGKLPEAATARREWWSNDQMQPAAHTRAWLDAGRQVDDVRSKRLVRISAARWRRSS
jgi:hypothetical protein